jgi:hypothetical protein
VDVLTRTGDQELGMDGNTREKFGKNKKTDILYLSSKDESINTWEIKCPLKNPLSRGDFSLS